MSRILIAFFALSAWLFPLATATAQPASRVAVTLHASSADPAPGKTTMLAIRFSPVPGWHGYWSNPGDSGLPPKVQWDVPAGVRVGALQHPAPQLLRVAGMASFVHEGQHVLLAPMQVPATFSPGDTLPVKGALDFLICSDSLCVPQNATVNLNLTVGKGTADPASRALFAAARQALPQSLSSTGEFTAVGRTVQLLVPAAAKLDPSRATFFPAGEGVFERSGARRMPDGSIEISGSMTNTPASLSGIVSDGRRAVQLRFRPASAPSGIAQTPIVPDSPVLVEAQAEAAPASLSLPSSSSPSTLAAAGATVTPGLVWALFGALIGGLLLNLMPCVFPILSLKALHLARSGSSNDGARRDALAYAGGTLATCVALGLILLGLREAGMAAGWSFQLQNPYVILALLALVTGIALNLAGLFHVTGPSFEQQSRGGGVAGSFGTGALAAFIATPCSAPFMASALGAALLLPPFQGLLVFAALGLGLALPFLALGWFPALRTRLPRPGAWMATLQRILSVPMFITALGLAWVLGRQVGIDGMALGLAAVLLFALGLWWFGRRQHGGKPRSWLPLLPAALISIGTASVVPAVASVPAAEARSQLVEPFSESRLAALRARGTPVFVDFTADWCLTCKVNEKAAIEREATKAAFARHGVVTLVGDWTRGDAEITRFLERHGRNSIPFYLFYAPGKEAHVLPQLLTTDGLVALAAQTPSRE